MVKLIISKGFKPRLSGRIDMSLIRLPKPATIAVSAQDIPFIRPKLLVKEGEPVKTGTPLFTDKRDKTIHYVSPGTGRVKQILFGERRRLLEVVIGLEGPDDYLPFEPIPSRDLAAIPPEDLVDRLKQGGVWQHLRQLPAGDTADGSQPPPMIIVSLNGNDLFSPDPAVLLASGLRDFQSGIELLKRFSDRIIITARESSFNTLGTAAELVTHVVPDIYPAWNPAVVLYHLKTDAADNSAWTVSADGLVMMARFLATGQVPTEKLVTVTKQDASKPHLKVRLGYPVRQLAGRLEPGDMITTGRFNGRILDADTHLGFFENTVAILPKGPDDLMFGFARPGLDTPTVSKTFLSGLLPQVFQPDCTLHGEERACINCSYCETICPVDLMPNFIMKALVGDDIEEALSLGLMDCVRCGLCSFTCPSKIELAHILSKGMASHHKDKA